MASIPVANIYYLLCYAWNEFAPRQIERHAAEEFPDTLHLFSRQLIIGLQSLHRRGPETGYIPLEESTSTPRGRILSTPSIRTMTMQPRRLYCAFDEMSADILTAAAKNWSILAEQMGPPMWLRYGDFEVGGKGG